VELLKQGQYEPLPVEKQILIITPAPMDLSMSFRLALKNTSKSSILY
jgi:hypothetical protein